MEEILASIRKIISEDQTEPTKAAPAPQPAAARAASVEEAAPAAEVDVLELTEEVREEEPDMPVAAPEPLIENDIAFETVEAEPKADPPMDDLISDTTRNAMDRAFAHLDRGSAELSAPAAVGGGTLDALFLRAIQDSFAPTLQEWVDSHHAEILERLKPVIRGWMDDNLPNLIETAVTKEISRAASASRPRGR
jgi:cell pole-organizing protein PopZ